MDKYIDVLKNIIIKQMQRKEKGSIYHWTQVLFAYNSNKIEGTRLSEDQTEQIFDSNRVFVKAEDNLMDIDDIFEVKNHFRLFDYMMNTLNEPITKEYMIKLNVILKRGTSYEDDPNYNVGGFKTKANEVGVFNVIKTTKPENVEHEIDELLDYYYSLENISIYDIAKFHVRFERIHPFGDGNGRVGRILMFKQCLENDIFPFIVLDRDRDFYIRGLREWDRDTNYLLDTLLMQQDIYKNICRQLDIIPSHEIIEKESDDDLHLFFRME